MDKRVGDMPNWSPKGERRSVAKRNAGRKEAKDSQADHGSLAVASAQCGYGSKLTHVDMDRRF